MNKENILEVNGVRKIFKKIVGTGTFLSLISSLRYNKENIVALNDVSFSLKKGENLGIIGKNGSGKSTLLRILANIYKKDKGVIRRNGSLTYISGFTYGLKRQMSVIDNIYILGYFLGLTRKEISKRVFKIIDFAELGNHTHTPIYQLSRGMMNKLGFSIYIHCISSNKPDIILIDEAISTGVDYKFQKKIIIKMRELLNSDSSVILVSHNLHIIKKYCDRVLWIEKGSVVKIGTPSDTVYDYLDYLKIDF